MSTPGAPVVPTVDELEHHRDRAILWMKLSLGLAIVWIPADIFDILAIQDALDHGRKSDLLDLSDVITASLAGMELVFLLGAGIAFIRWMRDAVRIVTLTGGSVRHPGWVVWGWIVPILSLFRPKQIVNDLHKATEFPGHEATPKREVVNWWWGAWIATFVTQGAARPFGVKSLEQFRTADYIDLVSQGATIAAAILAIRVVRGIDAGLTQRLSAAVAQGPQPPVPPAIGPPPPLPAPGSDLPGGWAPPVAPTPEPPPPPTDR
jgi:hypothetical protein